jgi:hypothetical protein
MNSPARKWLHGLIGGTIGGAAGAIDSALALIVLDPEKFNLGAGLKKTLMTAAVLGLLTGVKCAFAYLKQSPIPPESDSTPETK